MDPATIPTEETWGLEAMFESPEAFRQAKAKLERSLPELDAWRGVVGQSAESLADALDRATEAYRELAALQCYSSCRSDRDTRVAANQALRQGVELLGTRLSERVSYLRPEILALAPEWVERCIATEPRLAPHAFFLRDLMRQREHVLGPAEERILSHAGLVTRSAGSLYNVLNNAELPRPEVVLEDGRSVRLTPVNFHVHRASRHRADRLRVFPSYFSAYRAFQDTLGQNLGNALKAHLFRARSRGYPTCLSAALDPGNIPVAVYHNLIRQVRERLPLLHRYLRLRARALGLERLEYPDLYCPIGTRPAPVFGPDEARRLVVESLAPLGPRYVDALAGAFEARWIDWHPLPGKRSGAYATGAAYDAHPFVLLNFSGDLESVSTLAHEMGHAMHSHYSNAAQPFATASYPIFVAEVASTLNEALLMRHLIDRAADDDARVHLLGVHLDAFRGTLFRQALFAEFELAIHERVEQGEMPTGESLGEGYLALLRDYYGHDSGVMDVAEDYAVEWAAVPHFYFDFYVFQYATGITAATALAEDVISDRAATERYLAFLRSGGSDHALALLRGAGVDLESARPYETAFGAFERGVERLAELLGAR